MKYICPNCKKEYNSEEIKDNFYICPSCGNYLRMFAKDRIEMVVDKDSFEEWFEDLETINYFNDETYEETLTKAKDKTGLKEAIVVGKAKVLGKDIALGVCDSNFIMASMGHVVGEKVALLFEKATDEKLPVFIFCCSGGARMQEGMISLMQMEKTSAALKRHSDKGLFYCSILTDPTTGGVTASFATLADVILAEPQATIGFAGKRVIKQTIGEDLPQGFQTSEFLQEHGMIDYIVDRKDLRTMISYLISTNTKKDGYTNFNSTKYISFPLAISKLKGMFSKSKTAWEKVKDNRGTLRPTNFQYINEIFDDFVELKGDRLYRDDGAMLCGLATLCGQPVTIVANFRGNSTAEHIKRNFGMPMPEGYRKSLRLMKQAEKFNRPIICFVNTQGAYPGIGAEERGQGYAISQNLYELSTLKVPILSIVVGEGGSGGALAIAVADEVWMFENATYSILSPEGYASILWKDASRAEEAAEKMHIVAKDLKELNIIDKIIPEFGGANNETLKNISLYIKQEIMKFLDKTKVMNIEQMIENRYNRYRKF